MSKENKQIDDKQEKNTFSYAFKQQVMKAWQPVPTINSTIILFVLLTIFFVVFGIILLSFSMNIKEFSIRYDDFCQDYIVNKKNNQPCKLPIEIDEDMDGPVFVYYELDNFYQNHRQYVKSRSVDQLMGTTLTATEAEDQCKPVVYNSDVQDVIKQIRGQLRNYDNSSDLVLTDVASPCGLIAKSIFTDSYVIKQESNPTTEKYQILGDNIAWPSDKKNKYKRSSEKQKQWLDVEDERFMVWMRTAALPYFRKLWGRILTKIEKGKYILEINDNYNVTKFNGKKTFVLSTANAFGGKNNFLAIAYLVVGGLCLIITIAFLIKKLTSGQKKEQQKSN